MEIPIAGLVLASVGQGRTFAISIKNRFSKYSKGPETFQSLTEKLDKLEEQMGAVVEHLQSAPPSDPAPIYSAFLQDAESVQTTLKKCDSIIGERLARPLDQSASSSSKRAEGKRTARRVMHANSLSDSMKDIEKELEISSNKLRCFLLFLETRVVEGKVDNLRNFVEREFGSFAGTTHERFEVVVNELGKIRECVIDVVESNADVVGSKVDNLATRQDDVAAVLDNIQKSRTVIEEYRRGSNTPALPLGTFLDFDAKDENGKPSTPEGKLKKSILLSVSSSAVTAAAGVMTPAQSVHGMAGVGKTIALRGIAHDRDIRKRFPDGIYYMSFGQQATSLTAIGEIVNIMRFTGAVAKASVVENSKSLQKAVSYAVAWFKGKICLFLLDDMWPTKENKFGFFCDIRQLCKSHRESRMAITTRSAHIAHDAGDIVDFSPRKKLGNVSLSMFMAHVNQKSANYRLSSLTGDLRDSVVSILNSCAGLPLVLAVSGRAVSFLASRRGVFKGDFEGACGEYASRLEKQRVILSNVQVPEGETLFRRIELTLEILQNEFVNLKAEHKQKTVLSIADLYRSLCVLRNQGWVPISALSEMWEIDKGFAVAVVELFGELSLCELEQRQREYILKLHDLQLEFCRQKADAMNECRSWHRRILGGYLELPSRICEDSLTEQKLLAWKPKLWWSVMKDDYIPKELSRHLVGAGLILELAALLLDSRWTYKRFEIGGLLSLKGDFDCLLAVEDKVIPESVRKSFELVFKSIQVAWGRKLEGERLFLFYVCGWLCKHRAQNQIADAYLNSVESNTEKPYLRPVNAFFPDLLRSLIMEIPLGRECCAVDSSPCGRVVAAGSGADIVVVDVSEGEILKQLEGRTNTVTCVSFAGGSEKIVSGSRDNSIAVWDWKSSESPVRVLTGHSRRVNDVAVSSDGEKIFSCANDRTLRIWNANTGIQLGVYPQQSYGKCLSVSNDDRFVAIGLWNGNLKVLNTEAERTIFEDSKEHRMSIDSVGFCRTGHQLLTASRDACRVWDTVTWTSVGIPILPDGALLRCVKVSPDGLNIASGYSDGTLRLWDVKSRNDTWLRQEIQEPASSLSFTADGETMISGHDNGMIRFWDTSVGANATKSKYGRSRRVTAVASSDDGLRIVSGTDDGSVDLSDSCTGNQIGSMKGHTRGVTCVSFSHDGQKVVSGSLNGTIQLWDTFNQIGNVFKGHKAYVTCVSFSSDDKRIISACTDLTVRTWDVESGTESEDVLRFKIGIRAVYESSDRSCVVLRVAWGRRDIRIWNRSTQNFVWASQEAPFYYEDESTIINSCSGKNELTDREAQEIIRNCAQTSWRRWPDSFPEYTAELYFREKSVYWNVPKENKLLGTFPFHPTEWRYNETTKTLLVKALRCDSRIAICRLIL